MNPLLRTLSITACAILTPQSILAEVHPSTGSIYRIGTVDGSSVIAKPSSQDLLIKPWEGHTVLPIHWSRVKAIHKTPDNNQITVSIKNGDKVTGTWAHSNLAAESTIGSLEIPTDQINQMIQQDRTWPINIALDQPVSGQDGASHGKGLAKHVTDGDTKTHAKPPASHFDYTVTLGDGSNDGHDVSSVKIHWGRFGDRFKGIPSKDGKGWARAAWPGEYVTSYQLLYRTCGSDQWQTCHSWQGRPVDEDAAMVHVERHPTDIAGCSSESTTTLSELKLEQVTAMRIQARGGHWIGLYELEIFGH